MGLFDRMDERNQREVEWQNDVAQQERKGTPLLPKTTTAGALAMLGCSLLLARILSATIGFPAMLAIMGALTVVLLTIAVVTTKRRRARWEQRARDT